MSELRGAECRECVHLLAERDALRAQLAERDAEIAALIERCATIAEQDSVLNRGGGSTGSAKGTAINIAKAIRALTVIDDDEVCRCGHLYVDHLPDDGECKSLQCLCLAFVEDDE